MNKEVIAEVTRLMELVMRLLEADAALNGKEGISVTESVSALILAAAAFNSSLPSPQKEQFVAWVEEGFGFFVETSPPIFPKAKKPELRH